MKKYEQQVKQIEKSIEIWKTAKAEFIRLAEINGVACENLSQKLDKNFGTNGQISKEILNNFRQGRLMMYRPNIVSFVHKLENAHYRHNETNYDRVVKKNKKSEIKELFYRNSM